MDWARDHLGNDVPAWRGGISGFGLVCPSCGEPVRRRAGGERKPHFAHFSHRAKPDCENYFPPSGPAVLTGMRAVSTASAGRLSRESLSCGLFLVHQPELHSLALWLRIPSVELGSTATGSLEIQSGLGHRTYQVADLHTARLVPMAPQFPLATSIGSRDLLPLAAHVSGQVSAFTAERNLFYAEDKGGRFVFNDEPLEWGTRYRMLDKSVIAPPSELGSVLDWNAGQKFGGWNSYEMALPTAFAASKAQLPAQISEFLERRIRNPQSRIFVVQPFPHHIDVDGTYVYPESPASILMRRSASGKVTVKTPVDSVSAAVSDLTDEWVLLEGLPASGHDCTVSIEGNEQVVFRVEPCELFRPGGVIASVGDTHWDLCEAAAVRPSELLRNELKVECGSLRIATHVLRLNDGWLQEGVVLSSPSGVAKALFAGSFGELRSPVALPMQMNDHLLRGSMTKVRSPLPTRIWVEGLVLRTFGPEGLDRVRCYFAEPTRESLYRLGLIMTSPLMPYIRAAYDQQCAQGG